MRPHAPCPWMLLALAPLAGGAGCQTAPLRLLDFIGLTSKPVVIGVVTDPKPTAAVEVLNPFPRYTALQKALAGDLGRPVYVEPCLPFQAELALGSGWYHLAIVTPTQYARLSDPSAYKVLAIPLDLRGRAARCAVLVVSAASPVHEVPALRGKVVAFGPEDDARTHVAALQLLEQDGLGPKDLSLELLPVPGSLKHLPDARSVAQAVESGGAAAGFMDETAWDALPEHDERSSEPARDKLRIVAQTVALPEYLVIASPKLDAATADKICASLFAAGKNHPEALKPLGFSGYQAPSPDVLSPCRELIPHVPRQAAPKPADQAAPPAARPAAPS